LSGPPLPEASPEREPAQGVRGERAAAIVSGTGSLHSRASSLLAATLVIGIGVAALTWYYAHALSRPARSRQSAQATTASRAQAEMTLPALGSIVPPALAAPPANDPEPPQVRDAADDPGRAIAEPAPSDAAGAPPAKTAAQLAAERRLAGVVFAHAMAPATEATPAATSGPVPAAIGPGATRSPGSLGALLEPTPAPATQAQRLPDAHFLLPKGAFLDCTLETAIDSTLPGMTTCVTAADTFSADGKVVLLERGTKLVGETRGQLQQGQARLFVLWTQARTPGGVLVPLDSPGTDELGRAGVGGQVERHFWQRFGAAVLISVIEGGVQAGVQAASHSNGTIIYAPAGSQDVLTESLKDSAQIPPTLTKANGERIEVLVARDVDFRTVYELRTLSGR
jgi:type IV secretion system protein VirB10